MKFILSFLCLATFALSLPIVEKNGEANSILNEIIDFGPFIDTLFDTLKEKLRDDQGKLRIPEFTQDFSRKVSLFTVHARVKLSEGVITGLDTLRALHSTVNTTEESFLIETTLEAPHVNVSFVGRAGIKIFKYFYKRIGVSVDIRNLVAHLAVFKNRTDPNAKPQLQALSFGKLKLGVKIDTHLGRLSWLANKLVNAITSYLIDSVDLNEKLVDLIKPLVDQALKSIDIPIN